jgi:hypothetical protein
MMPQLILAPRSNAAVDAWFARAAQARRISLMLSARDAALLNAFAEECEAQAMQLARGRVPVSLAA